jgi:glycosyltransferase involved in cell wall biosynthesis
MPPAHLTGDVIMASDTPALMEPYAPLTNDAVISARQCTRPVICQVLHTLQVGGGEVLARAFAVNSESEFKPVFALLDELGSLGHELRDAGYTVEVVGRKSGFDIGCARRLRRLFRKHQVSMVHAHQYGPLLYSALARLPAMRIPILFTEHGRDFPDFRRWKRVLANRVLFGARDRFIAVGNAVRNALVEYEGFPPSRIDVIYNGRDLTEYDPSCPQRNAVRQELGISEDNIVVMQVARFNRLKDHATAIRTFGLLRDTSPRTKLVLIGDGEERASIEQLIDGLRLRDSVRLLGTRSDIARLLQGADVFLLTSISEGIPLTLIEAMATGLPCVATRVGGIPEVVIDGETGLLVDVGDDGYLAECIHRLTNDSTLRRQFGNSGCERAAKLFDANDMQAAYLRIYRELSAPVVSRAMRGQHV